MNTRITGTGYSLPDVYKRQMSASMDKQMGSPDLFILFTNTVSHKMVKTAVDEAKKNNVQVVRCHTSSGSALENILDVYKRQVQDAAFLVLWLPEPSRTSVTVV